MHELADALEGYARVGEPADAIDEMSADERRDGRGCRAGRRDHACHGRIARPRQHQPGQDDRGRRVAEQARAGREQIERPGDARGHGTSVEP